MVAPVEPYKLLADGTRAHMRGYQKRGALRLYREPSVGLLVDMGLGKTVIVLTAVCALLRHRMRTGALVVVPLRVLQTKVWQEEAAAWSHTKHLKFVEVYGNDAEKLRAINSKADIYITNYETLKWFGKMVGRKSKKSKIPMPDILVLDESSAIRNHQSVRFRVLKYRLFRFFKTAAILTGTPMPNSLMELWAQIFMLDRGARLGKAYTRFKTRFFEQMDYRGFKWEPRKGATKYVLNLIKDVVLRLDSKDWVQMPEIVPDVVRVALPDDVQKLYKKHERQMFIELANQKVVSATTAATLSMQCWQIANGAIYDDEEVRDSWTVLHDRKIKALEEIIESHPGQSLLVAYWFRHDIARLRVRWPKARTLDKHNAEQTKKDWNARKIPLLFMQARASHGLNMQYGGHIVVWFSLTWSLEAHDQLIARLRRPDNASDHILSLYIACMGTVDELIMRAIERKDRDQRYALDWLRKYAQRRTA